MNLFVAKLNPESTSEDLQKLFAHYGEVSTARVIIDKDTGRSKRYGFVEMPNEIEANEALKELNETEYQESIIVVKESLPRENQAGHHSQPTSENRREGRIGSNFSQKSPDRRNQPQQNGGREIKSQGKSPLQKYGSRI